MCRVDIQIAHHVATSIQHAGVLVDLAANGNEALARPHTAAAAAAAASRRAGVDVVGQGVIGAKRRRHQLQLMSITDRIAVLAIQKWARCAVEHDPGPARPVTGDPHTRSGSGFLPRAEVLVAATRVAVGIGQRQDVGHVRCPQIAHGHRLAGRLGVPVRRGERRVDPSRSDQSTDRPLPDDLAAGPGCAQRGVAHFPDQPPDNGATHHRSVGVSARNSAIAY